MLQLVKDLSPSGIFFLFLLLSLFELALTHAQPLTLALRCSALPHPPPFLSRLTSKFILNIFIIQTYFPSLLFPFSHPPPGIPLTSGRSSLVSVVNFSSKGRQVNHAVPRVPLSGAGLAVITLFDGHGGSVASALSSSIVGPAVFERLSAGDGGNTAAASSSSLWNTVSWLVGGTGASTGAPLTVNEAADGGESRPTTAPPSNPILVR